MAAEKLMVEMGKFTGQEGLQVYERLKSEVNSEWDRLQKTQVPKSSNLRSSEAVMENIVVKALDRFLSELPAKEALERKVGHVDRQR
jgi:hypothetical protein